MTEDLRREGIKVPPTATEAEAARVALEMLETGARRNQASFTRPDADWKPIWMVLNGRRQGTILTGTVHKHKMTQRVGAFARKVGAVAIGHLHSSWGIFAEDGVPLARMREIRRQMERQHGSSEGIPERRECLLIQIHTATTWAHYRILIDRTEDRPPKLGPLEKIGPEQMKVAGPMVTPLREALRRIG